MFHKNGLLALAELVVWKEKNIQKFKKRTNLQRSKCIQRYHKRISETSFATKGRGLRDDSVGHVVVVVEAVGKAIVVINRRSKAVEGRLWFGNGPVLVWLLLVLLVLLVLLWLEWIFERICWHCWEKEVEWGKSLKEKKCEWERKREKKELSVQ